MSLHFFTLLLYIYSNLNLYKKKKLTMGRVKDRDFIGEIENFQTYELSRKVLDLEKVSYKILGPID